MSTRLDPVTLLALRDSVRVVSTPTQTRVYIGEVEIFRWVGCANSHGNRFHDNLREAFATLAAKESA